MGVSLCSSFFFSRAKCESVSDYWWRRSQNTAEYFYHRLFLFITCLLRLIALPHLLYGKHPGFALFVYTCVELYWRTVELDAFPPFTLSMWHGDHVARLIQMTAISVALFTTHLQLPPMVGVAILHVYCLWFPRHSWIHILTSMIVQNELNGVKFF